MTIQDRYIQGLDKVLSASDANVARKFSFTLKAMAAEYLHGKLYDVAFKDASLNSSSQHQESYSPAIAGYAVSRETFAGKFFGTTMWDNLVIVNQDPNVNLGNLRIDMVLITVSQTKNIIKTAIQGVNGTVKEYISDGDYQISITGAFFGRENEYPEDDVLLLLDYLKQHNALRVQSEFLQLFDIDDIVVENYRFDAKEGMNNAQFFEISAISEIPQELIFGNE